jgi:hypothetical protein
MQEYIKSKNKKDDKSKIDDKNNNKKKKIINNKKKIILNNLSFDFPLEYNKNFINTEISKFIF